MQHNLSLAALLALTASYATAYPSAVTTGQAHMSIPGNDWPPLKHMLNCGNTSPNDLLVWLPGNITTQISGQPTHHRLDANMTQLFDEMQATYCGQALSAQVYHTSDEAPTSSRTYVVAGMLLDESDMMVWDATAFPANPSNHTMLVDWSTSMKFPEYTKVVWG